MSINAQIPTEYEDTIPDNDVALNEVPGESSKTPSTHSEAPSLPRLSRAFSMPLPSQLGHWQHPVRSQLGMESDSLTPALESQNHFQDLALELADSVQLAIQTLFHLSPPHLFDPGKEQLSACTVQIPTPSLNALLTSMKNLNYISANIQTLGFPSQPEGPYENSDFQVTQDALVKDDFDIGEVLQSVGDSFAGLASEADVDLVLHHGDAIKHMGVKGDECGLSYALSHIMQQVLATTKRGDSIEIGLSITGHPHPEGRLDPPIEDADSPLLDADGPVVCTFDVAHMFASISDMSFSEVSYDAQAVEENETPTHVESRPEPALDSVILRRLLAHIGGTLRPSLEARSFPRGRRCELSVTLDRGPSLATLYQKTPPVDDVCRDLLTDIPLAREPSIDELISFADTLRGKRVAFHASSRGSFAHHLTRYLTAWGMDISHIPTEEVEENPVEDSAEIQLSHSFGNSSAVQTANVPNGDSIPPIIDTDPPTENVKSSETTMSFIIIDDDPRVLRRRLLQHRAEVLPNLTLHSRKRPTLAAHHRPRSSPSIRNALLTANAQMQHLQSPPAAFIPVPIVHFTSLAKYKVIKNIIHAFVFTPESLLFHPEIIVIPKPAGPRRFLTALHTAVSRPMVDPCFSPIATFPTSPGGGVSPFMSGRKPPSTVPPPSSNRTGPEKLVRGTSEATTTVSSSSPLSIPDEYFSEGSIKKLGGNAASGFLMQSPDGRPAILFQPQSRSSSTRTDVSLPAMDHDRASAPGPPAQISRSRRGTSRMASMESVTEGVEPRNEPPVTLVSPLTKSEYGKAYKGKWQRSSPEQVQARTSSPISWREATQKLVEPLLTSSSAPILPITDVSDATGQSQIQEHVIPVLVRQPSIPSISTTPIRSPTSPASGDGKKAARRSTVGPKSPGTAPNTKKSKSVGNNIVPPICVLIVEDNAINQTILSTFMRRNKIKYEVAWNGREAVDKWKTGNFHLILMDIQMPVMDGIEATKEIRRLERAEAISGHFPSTPSESSRHSAIDSPGSRSSTAATTPFRSQVIIVALTASSLQSDRVAALAAGCNDFLTKPVTNSWLNDKIIEWGSIKALQMWAELRPDIANNMREDQAAQAQAVADRLHVPPGSARNSPGKSVTIPLPASTESHRATSGKYQSLYFNIDL
ncbi:hypothetical protein BU17DRAFT_56116 [Hysterangium stoloniferum]|nr:hypothetical protein BU17DRAFT_56116 [Hysterangium stoloniferum]